MSASYNDADQQQDGGAGCADHDVFDALDTQDGFFPSLSAHRLMGVEFSFDRCDGWFSHNMYLK